MKIQNLSLILMGIITGMTNGAFAADQYVVSVAEAGSVRVRVSGTSEISGKEQVLPIRGAESISIVDEPYENLSPNLPHRWEGETHLRQTISAGTVLPDCLVPDSVRVTLADGTPMEEGKDYTVNTRWAAIARTPEGRITTDSAVLVSYGVGLMRLDSIVLDKGTVRIIEGIPAKDVPHPAGVPDGIMELARVFRPYHSTTVEPWHIFTVGEPFPEPDAAEMERHSQSVPKTLAKLRNGETVTIVTWGDSVTDGSDVIPIEKSYAREFITRLRERFPQAAIKHINAGIGGTNTEGRLPGLQQDVLKHKPDLVTIEFVNDMDFPEEVFRRNHNSAIDQIKGIGAEVIEITPHFTMTEWMKLPHPRGHETRPAVTWLREIAAEKQIGLADTSKRWEHLEKEGIPYLTLLQNGINHPDARGHELFVRDLLSFFPADGSTMTSDNQESSRSPLKYRIALLGNPIAYPEYTEERLNALVDAGFNGIQLNIAWLRRPNDEALNLNDVVTLPGEVESTRTAERRAQLQERNRLAKKAGMRTMFHFGSPFMWRNPDTGEVKRNSSEAYNSDPSWFDIQNPKIVAYEVALLKEFKRQFPDVDDILVYTYDQDAWQASEWTQSKVSRGIPLHDRLPQYLSSLHAAWMEGRPEGADNIMWWEPWELSAGQVYMCLPKVPRKNFGMMLHTNIAEVQITRPIDVWFRNTARICKELGIPVIGEAFFGSATEEIEPLSFPTPRLTDEELKTMLSVDGLTGIKEYFGVIPLIGDLNLEIFAERVKDGGTTVPTSVLLEKITARFGDHQQETLKLLEELSAAIQMYPWDVSWYARLAGTGSIDHGWTAAFIRGQQVETPSWESTRRSLFMMTEDQQPHPFLIEDIHLRMDLAIQHLDNALSIGATLIPNLQAGVHKTMFEKAMIDVEKLKRVATSYAVHLRMTNVAMLLRGDLEIGRPLSPHLKKEMDQLFARDIENQGNRGRVMDMYKEWQSDPETFVKKRLLPITEAPREQGVFTLTTR